MKILIAQWSEKHRINMYKNCCAFFMIIFSVILFLSGFKIETDSGIEMNAKRAAGFLIFRRVNNDIQYLMLKARLVINDLIDLWPLFKVFIFSYGNKHWTPPKGYTSSLS
jgi:hypothetical protein